jgi:hypothetical protein
MTADQRLDQLEPIMGEMLKKQDELATQNQALAKMYFDLTVGQMNTRKDVSKVAIEQKEQGERLTKIEGRLEKMEDMITAIYQAVQKPSGN